MDAVETIQQLGPWVGLIGSAIMAWRSSASAKAASAEAERLRASTDAKAVEQLEKWIQELRSRLRGLQSRMRGIEAERDDAQGALDDCKRAHAEQAVQIAALEEKATGLEGTCAVLKSQVGALREERDALQRAIAGSIHNELPPPPPIPSEMKVDVLIAGREMRARKGDR